MGSSYVVTLCNKSLKKQREGTKIITRNSDVLTLHYGNIYVTEDMEVEIDDNLQE
jgi:hypothetical protein